MQALALTMAAVWLPFGTRDQPTLYAVVGIFGFDSGGWLSLAVCAGQLCRTEEYGLFYGTIYSVAAFGVLLTVPVGGVLQSTTAQALMGIYSAMLLAGLVSLTHSQWAFLEWKLQWQAKV